MSKVSTDAAGLLSGELARLAGVSTDTLRHYERKGVLPRPARSGNGYRRYPPDSVERVRLIRRALSVGFTLDELARFLKSRERGQPPCREVRALAAQKLKELEARLAEMAALRDDLRAALRDWDRRLAGKGEGQRAGLLESLAGREGVGPAPSGLLHKRTLRKKVK
ncbi:MAG: heavy metal-responsive transcriptional regulator [Acidobacteriota bacterium]|nr:heavy metal-responsive transcriptional regulator [Acidobacteriota bacterium]